MANSMSDQGIWLHCQIRFLCVAKIILLCNKVGCFVSRWKLILSQRQWGADLVFFTLLHAFLPSDFF